MDRLSNHISELGFKNYRVFDNNDLYKIELKPITFITGANSSGKSSIFKALMLLEENRKANNLFELMFFSGTHILGSISGIQNKENKPIIFSVTRKNRHNENVSLELEYNLDGFLVKATLQSNQKDLIKLSYTSEDKYNIELKLDIFANSELREKIQFLEVYDDSVESKLTLFVKDNLQEWIRVTKENKIESEIEQLITNYIDEEEEKLFIERNKALIGGGFNPIEYNFNVTAQLSNIESEERRNEFIEIINIFEEKLELIKIKANSTDKQEEFKDKIEEETQESSKSEQEYISEFTNDIQNKIINHQLSVLINLDIQENKKNNILNGVRTEVLDVAQKYLLFFKDDEELNVISKFLPIPEIAKQDYVKTFTDIFFDKNIHKVFYQRLMGDYIDMFFSEPAPFFHIPVDRGRQKRIITFSNQNDVLENALAFINLQDTRTPEQEEFVRKWFCDKEDKNKFDIGFDYKIKEIEGKSVFFRVYKSEADFNNEKEEKGRTLADLGLGISQLMPIILSCINPNNEGKTIFIEEPETNLHPKFQSLLAEMFLDASKKFNIQFVIETHSEYLIRKMQELVVGEIIDKEDSIIYYFRSSNHTLKEGENKFEKIEFDKDGKIDYWKFGKGFFDTDYELEFGALNLQAQKLFKSLKNDLNGLSDEKKRTKIEERINHYTDVQDLSRWEKELKEEIPHFEKLNIKTKHYLASAKFFLGIFDKSKTQNAINNKIDFAPVIMQYGKAVENELETMCKELYTGTGYTFSLQNIQRQFEGTVLTPNTPLNLSLFDLKHNDFNLLLNSIKNVNNIIDLNKLVVLDKDRNNEPDNDTLLGFIRSYRNASSHSNKNNSDGIWDCETAINYQYYVVEFFKLWCRHLK